MKAFILIALFIIGLVTGVPLAWALLGIGAFLAIGFWSCHKRGEV